MFIQSKTRQDHDLELRYGNYSWLIWPLDFVSRKNCFTSWKLDRYDCRPSFIQAHIACLWSRSKKVKKTHSFINFDSGKKCFLNQNIACINFLNWQSWNNKRDFTSILILYVHITISFLWRFIIYDRHYCRIFPGISRWRRMIEGGCGRKTWCGCNWSSDTS